MRRNRPRFAISSRGNLLPQPAIVQDDDLVCRLHGAHAVGDDQYVLPASRRRALPALSFRSPRPGEAVASSSKHNGRPSKSEAGDGDALALAAGEARAVFADGRIVAPRQPARILAVGGLAAARGTSSSLAPRLPRRMFSITVSSKSTTSRKDHRIVAQQTPSGSMVAMSTPPTLGSNLWSRPTAGRPAARRCSCRSRRGRPAPSLRPPWR